MYTHTCTCTTYTTFFNRDDRCSGLLTAEAYSERFKAIFSSVAKTYPSFSVGKSLVGILMDWSDQQFNGLEQAVGKDVAEAVVKGCQVHIPNYIYPDIM